MTTTSPEARPVEQPGPVRERTTRSAAHLVELFTRRPDLRGVHAPADLAEDAVRWSA